MPDDKANLLLVDRQTTRRQSMTSKLSVLYKISDFAAIPPALRHARVHPTDIILILEDAGGGEDFDFLKSMRLEPIFSTLPIIVLLAGENSTKHAAVVRAGASASMAEPYILNSIIQMISKCLNQAVEKSWERLPQLQAAALKSTVSMFNAVSDQIAAGVPIVYEDIKTACEPLLEAVNSGDVKSILKGVQAYDNYTYAHSLRVAVFLSLFGSGIGLAKEDLSVLMTGGLLHDLGKIEIPSLLLNKPGRLDVDEHRIMQGHVPATLRILQKSPDMNKGVMIVAGQHHEKLDGKGYPFQLSGKKLNELARMAAITDVFSALTDRRVYKPAMTPEQAFEIMAEEMGSHFDIGLLGRFRELLLDNKFS